jgi:predicted Rossmann-fold nucleotide-binding protein
LNVCEYYDRLLSFLNYAVSEMFIKQEHRDMILVGHTPDTLLEQMINYRAPDIEKWFGEKRR